MERVKMQLPGEKMIMTVASVSAEEIQNMAYFLFADLAHEVLIPASSVERQLVRVGVEDVKQLIGRTILISRSLELSKFGKPYWNLDPARPEPEAPRSPYAPPRGEASLPAGLQMPPSTEAAFQATARPAGNEKNSDLYKRITQFVLREIAPLYVEAKIGMSPESATAAVATIFIQEMKR